MKNITVEAVRSGRINESMNCYAQGAGAAIRHLHTLRYSLPCTIPQPKRLKQMYSATPPIGCLLYTSVILLKRKNGSADNAPQMELDALDSTLPQATEVRCRRGNKGPFDALGSGKIPVSYTHLDVYKRQLFAISNDSRDPEPLTPAHFLVASSLDVYKRQRQFFPRL